MQKGFVDAISDAVRLGNMVPFIAFRRSGYRFGEETVKTKDGATVLINQTHSSGLHLL